MAEFAALPLFTDAYLADTRHLTTLQHGAYLLMLMTAWRSPDCSLPNDDIYLARICGMDKRTWAANKSILLSFWRIGNDAKLQQGRLKDERNYVDHKRNKNSEAGKASALKRKNRDSTGVQPNGNQTSTPSPSPSPTPNGIDKSIPKKTRQREKVSLVDLSIDHIASWLAKKRSEGKYIHHNEVDILEYFKTYCESKNKRYDDYAAALRLSFDWERNQPKGNTNGSHQQLQPAKPTWSSEAERVAAKYRAEAEAEDECERQRAAQLRTKPDLLASANIRNYPEGA